MAELNLRDNGPVAPSAPASLTGVPSALALAPQRGLRISWLVAMVILSVFLPMAILLSQQLQRTADALSEKELAQVSALAADFRVLYETAQEAAIRRMTVLAESGIDYASPECNARFKEMLDATVELVNIVFIDPKGNIVCGAQPSRPGISVLDRDYFKTAVTAQEPFGSRLIIGRISGLPLQLMVLPVRSEDGAFEGLIATGLKLDWVAAKIADTKDALGVSIPEMNLSFFDRTGQQNLTTPSPAAWSYRLLDDLGPASVVQTSRLPDSEGQMRTYATTALDTGGQIFLAVSLPEAEQAARARLADDNSFRLILIAGFLVLSLNLVVGHLLLVRPIQRLREGANAITEETSADIDAQFAPREVNDLRNAINHLAATLDRRTKRLATSNEELQQANADLSAFTYAASHDLKSPVNSVDMVLTELAQVKEISHSETLELVGGARSALSRMQNMIRDVLTFAQIVGDRAEFYRTTTADLNEVLFDVREDLAFEVRRTDADIRVAPLPAITGNYTLLHVLFINLVGNALKYSRPDVAPAIRIRKGESADPEFGVIEVEDNGMGIPPDCHAQIFQMFKRLHNHEEIEGTGIGLGICTRIARGHGGHISLTSEVGAGSTFRFHYPLHLEQH
ncbi:MAG: ATP-binding protein [Pseudomonadota bacterium]